MPMVTYSSHQSLSGSLLFLKINCQIKLIDKAVHVVVSLLLLACTLCSVKKVYNLSLPRPTYRFYSV